MDSLVWPTEPAPKRGRFTRPEPKISLGGGAVRTNRITAGVVSGRLLTSNMH